MSDKQLTKKEHFIPKFYLKEFKDSDSYLHCYDFCKMAPFKTRPKEFAFKVNLYETLWTNADPTWGKYVLPNNIEKCYSKYEGNYSHLLNRIKNIVTPHQNPTALILNSSEKRILFSFITNLLVRNPENMNILGVNEASKDINNSTEVTFIEPFLKEIGIYNMDSLIVAAMKKLLLTETIEGSPIFQFIASLENYKLGFLYNKDDTFITCTIPVIYAEDPYMAAEDKTIFYLPLTPKIAILLGNYRSIKSNHIRIISPELSDLFNKRVIQYSKKNNLTIIANTKSLIEKYIKYS